MRVKETRNHLVGLFGLGEIGFVPEAVVEGLEDGELRRTLLLHGMQWLVHSSGVHQTLSRIGLSGLAG
jgi:hypothetical protein